MTEQYLFTYRKFRNSCAYYDKISKICMKDDQDCKEDRCPVLKKCETIKERDVGYAMYKSSMKIRKNMKVKNPESIDELKVNTVF
jgi:hypothetical protein